MSNNADSLKQRQEEQNAAQARVPTIPLSELFYSIEGEGPHTGRPTLFVRTFGCNFQCRGFGNRGLAPVEVDPTAELAQVKTDVGCDTIYSWHPAYRKFSRQYTPRELDAEIVRTLRNAISHDAVEGYAFMESTVISLTGGEPMLHQKQFAHLICVDDSEGEEPTYIEKFGPTILIETNGSVPLHQTFLNAARMYPGILEFSISPKLSISGEPREKAIRAKVIADYFQVAPSSYVKFVSDGTDESLAEVASVLAEYNEEFVKRGMAPLGREKIWIMAEGATLEQQQKSQRGVAEAALRYGYSFSPRVHVWIWGNTVGT